MSCKSTWKAMAIKGSYSVRVIEARTERGGSHFLSQALWLCLSLSFWCPLVLILPLAIPVFCSFPGLPHPLKEQEKAGEAIPSGGKPGMPLLAVKDTEKCVCRLGGGLKQQTNLSHSTRNILSGFKKSWSVLFSWFFWPIEVHISS